MKTWIKDVTLITTAVCLGALGTFFQYKSGKDNHIHAVVVEAFGSTCVGMGYPFTMCTCMLGKASVEMSSEEFHSMNMRVFGNTPTADDLNTMSRWKLECGNEFMEHLDEDGPFDVEQRTDDMMDAPGVEM